MIVFEWSLGKSLILLLSVPVVPFFVFVFYLQHLVVYCGSHHSMLEVFIFLFLVEYLQYTMLMLCCQAMIRIRMVSLAEQ